MTSSTFFRTFVKNGGPHLLDLLQHGADAEQVLLALLGEHLGQRRVPPQVPLPTPQTQAVLEEGDAVAHGRRGQRLLQHLLRGKEETACVSRSEDSRLGGTW